MSAAPGDCERPGKARRQGRSAGGPATSPLLLPWAAEPLSPLLPATGGTPQTPAASVCYTAPPSWPGDTAPAPPGSRRACGAGVRKRSRFRGRDPTRTLALRSRRRTRSLPTDGGNSLQSVNTLSWPPSLLDDARPNIEPICVRMWWTVPAVSHWWNYKPQQAARPGGALPTCVACRASS